MFTLGPVDLASCHGRDRVAVPFRVSVLDGPPRLVIDFQL
jgi:hypothetical protein